MSQERIHPKTRGEHDRHDVIVVGAGPAGSTCARICANRGLTTLLLDKDVFPRHKPCAGAVSARALSLLGFPLPADIIEKECFGARIGCKDRSIVVRKKERIAVLVSRDRFDRFLADKAIESGVRFVTGERVVAIAETEEAVTVTTDKKSYEARFVIGADGVHSVVARSVRPPFQKNELALALVSNSRADDEIVDQRLQDVIAIDFGLAPLGYGWLFPHRGYFSVGLAGQASAFSRPRDALSEYGRSIQVTLGAIHGHFIPFGGIKRKIAANRILLAGDAAGFADAFHGEGIVHAILSGKLAAEAVSDGLSNVRDPADAAARYRRECERLIRKQLRVSLFLARLLDRFPRLFIRIFFDNKSALERYLDIPAGRTDYRRFLGWLAVRTPLYLLASCMRRPNHTPGPLSSIENKGS